MQDHCLIIDQGTTNTRATLINPQLRPLHSVSVACAPEHLPGERWEQDPDTLWQAVLTTMQRVVTESGLGVEHIAGLGITNQRETTVLWDADTGQVVHPALTWQDRRTETQCNEWRQAGHEDDIRARTGLLLDPQFSAGKLHWLFRHHPELQTRARQGRLRFGTIDSFLLWRLTAGQVHATDTTNASRTLLYNLTRQQWDTELLDFFDLAPSLLPELHNSASAFGLVDPQWLGTRIPVLSMIGDQQASLLGHGCISDGDVKATYGRGCFALVNSGARPVFSQNRLLTTLAYQLPGETCYALEGSVVTAGSVVDWLEEDLNLVTDRHHLAALAETVPLEQTEIMVPAFTGLGAPYWEQHVRGAVFGLTRDTRIRHLVAAALRSVAYQTEDMLKAMRYDNIHVASLHVDGGDLTQQWFLQSLSDLTGIKVITGDTAAITARGTAMLCGLQLGWFDNLHTAAALCGEGPVYQPRIDDALRDRLLRGWDDAVRRIQAPA